MKSINRIMILTLAAALIVRFWLMPGINTATAQQYTRVYEDTDRDARLAQDTTKRQKKVKPPKGPGNPEEEYPLTEKYHEPGKKSGTEKRNGEKEASGKLPPPRVDKIAEPSEKNEYKSAKPAKPKKVYKKQTIRPKDKNVKLEAKMFSRAVQFVEEVPLDSTEAVVVEAPVSKAPF